MSHCHDEHAGHSHNHGGHNGIHDHSEDLTPALQHHIYEQIDFSAINVFNETDAGSGTKVVQKTWAQRLEDTPELVSDDEGQLLMTIPFTAQVRLHSILLRTSPTSSAPKTLHIHLNRDDLDLSSATDAKPTQTLELSQSSEIHDIAVKRALFNTTRTLQLFFPVNFGNAMGDDEERTRINYLGFRGDWMRLSREPVNFLYEAAAQPGDHKMIQGVERGLGQGLGGPGGGRQGM